MTEYDETEFMDEDEKVARDRKYAEDYKMEMGYEYLDAERESGLDIANEIRVKHDYLGGAVRYSNDGAQDARRNRLELEAETKKEDADLRSQGGGHMGDLMDHIDQNTPADSEKEGIPERPSRKLLRQANSEDRTGLTKGPGF